jgi:acyl-CoA synthetase (AMP-forming)/AMP-acid ligase II
VASVITEWITSPRAGRGIYLAEDTSGWRFHDYPGLAASARRVGVALRKAGVRPGDVVCVIMPTSFPCLSTLFGIWVAGGTVCTIAEPLLQSPQEYVANLAVLLTEAEPVVVVTTSENSDIVREGMAAAGRDDMPWLYQEEPDELAPQPTREIAVLQFTSGSTGSPRAACVSWNNLAANLKVITRVLGWRDDDGIASWLPLHHDLGLLGCLLTFVATQGNGWLMRPEQFLRDAAVANATGLGRGRLSVVGSQDGGRPSVVLFAEAPPGEWAEAARHSLRSRVGPGCPITIISGRAGLVQRTSSGKPQRRRMWEMPQSGLPDGAQIIEDPADAGAR